MDDWQKNIINNMFARLISDTNCDEIFLSKFLTENTITDHEYNRLVRLPHQAHLGAPSQNSEFYKIIRTRVGAFRQLFLYLKETNQSGLADLLSELTRKNYPEKYNYLVNNGQDEQLATSLSINCDGNRLSSCVQPSPVDEENRIRNHYKFSGNGKRFILPINIVHFKNAIHNRENARIDMSNIKSVFPKLGYEVFPEDVDEKLYYSREDILLQINDFKDACRLFKAESCILFIGSHGMEDKIYSSEGNFVRINKHIVQQFYHENFPCMKGKPKIIIIQACRNFEDGDAYFTLADNDDDSSTKSEGVEENDQIKEGAISDTVIIHSQVPGLPSSRNDQVGSWLVHYITKVFEEKAENTSVMNMLREVRDKLNEHNRNPAGQIPEIRDLGYKDFRLPCQNLTK
ncbi:caspase-2-like isoform X2 [Bradysia coprophila]|uniref:caspase-2-like isoform X2 n=1 Tax=Bradysia coprophila TaxID=38358 RepID=UPI00187DA992|nr:caspase-2-like isoform X2 [Bradysia coprophila]